MTTETQSSNSDAANREASNDAPADIPRAERQLVAAAEAGRAEAIRQEALDAIQKIQRQLAERIRG